MFNFSHRIAEIKASVIWLVLILASTILGLIWVSVGLYSFLSKLWGPLWGPLALGGAFLLPIAIWGVIKALQPRGKSKQQLAYEAAFANSSVGAISRMIESLSGHSPFLATAVAVIGGFLATRFPQFLAVFSELVTAYGDELARRGKRRANEKAQAAADMETRGQPQPPPDVEPIVKRRGKKATEDIY